MYTMKCLICRDILISKHSRDYVSCTCGNLSIDGGLVCPRMTAKELDKVEDLTEIWGTEDEG